MSSSSNVQWRPAMRVYRTRCSSRTTRTCSSVMPKPQSKQSFLRCDAQAEPDTGNGHRYHVTVTLTLVSGTWFCGRSSFARKRIRASSSSDVARDPSTIFSSTRQEPPADCISHHEGGTPRACLLSAHRSREREVPDRSHGTDPLRKRIVGQKGIQ